MKKARRKQKIRPTSDLVKQAVFNILGDIEGLIFFDLFAGTGQTRAGRMVNVRIKAVGKHVPKGKPIASLESGKWTGPVPAVIEGEVLERNEELFDMPDLINDYPYTRGWIAKLKPTNLERDLKDLVTGEEAVQRMKEYIDREGVECKGQ